MSLVDTINQMRQNNMNDNEIMRSLQEQGYSPAEIDYSLSQANIVPASTQDNEEKQMFQVQNSINHQDQNEMQGMQPSMMSAPVQNSQRPMLQGYSQYPQTPVQQPITQEMGQPYEQYAEYPSQQEYEPYLPSTSDTMTEIAQEIVDEKLQKIDKEIGNLAEFKINMDSRMKSLSDKIKRIESIIDKLQLSILKKVSMYGEDLSEIKSEITKTQESFSKVLNPLVDKARQAKPAKPVGKEKSEKKHSMDHYLTR